MVVIREREEGEASSGLAASKDELDVVESGSCRRRKL